MTDFYRNRLKHAAWTWNEGKHCRFHKPLRNKDRDSGRAEKRSARQDERAEIEAEAAHAGNDIAEDAATDFSTCPCSDCVAERERASIPEEPTKI